MFRPFSAFSRCLINRSLRNYGDRCLSNETTEVILLKGLKSTPQIKIENQTIKLPTHMIAGQTNLQFYTPSSELYHACTPLELITKESFYVRWNELVYFVLRNDPSIDDQDNDKLFKKYGGMTIEHLIKKMLENLPAECSGLDFHNFMVRKILEESERFKFKKLAMQKLLKVVEDKIKFYDESWEPFERKLQRSANRIVRSIITFFIAQFAIVNYFVYFYLSWDIMEPITVLLGNFQLLVAYIYFIYNNRSFSYGKISEGYQQRRKRARMLKEGFDVERYSELKNIQQYLKLKLTLEFGTEEEVVEILKDRIRLLKNNERIIMPYDEKKNTRA